MGEGGEIQQQKKNLLLHAERAKGIEKRTLPGMKMTIYKFHCGQTWTDLN